MNYLIVLSLVSLLGATFMLAKRIQEMAPHVESAGRYAHTNFIAEYFKVSKKRAKVVSTKAYLKARPHAHTMVANIASGMYKLSSFFAREFLKFYNFIQGRKVLKNSGNTSMFIRDLTK